METLACMAVPQSRIACRNATQRPRRGREQSIQRHYPRLQIDLGSKTGERSKAFDGGDAGSTRARKGVYRDRPIRTLCPKCDVSEAG
jgi:hypothetical protein